MRASCNNNPRLRSSRWIIILKEGKKKECRCDPAELESGRRVPLVSPAPAAAETAGRPWNRHRREVFGRRVFFLILFASFRKKKVDESPRQTLPDAVDIGLRPNFFALGFYETDLKKKTTFKQKFKFSEQLKPNHQILHRNWTCSIKPNWASKSNTLLRK